MNNRFSVCVIDLTFVLCAGFFSGGCEPGDDLPDLRSDTYLEVVSLHHSAVSRLQAGEELGAIERFTRIVSIAPGEPSAWYNLGLMALRRNEVDRADEYLENARTLLPMDVQINLLSGLLERRRNRPIEAAEYFRRVVDLDPANLKALYALAQEAERGGSQDGLEEAEMWTDIILSEQSSNIPARLGSARIALALRDSTRLRDAVEMFDDVADQWDSATRTELENLRTLVRESDFGEIETQVRRLDNMLKRTPEYRRDLGELTSAEEAIAEVMTRLRRLPMPSYGPAPADSTLEFSIRTEPLGDTSWDWIGIFHLNGEDPSVLVTANADQVLVGSLSEFAFPGGGNDTPPLPQGLAALDYDYDFRMDLALAGDGGFKLFRQGDDGAFVDVTVATGLPASITGRAYTGVWAMDLDAEGDLDLVLGSTSETRAFINNGDGTFSAMPLFEASSGLSGMTWADMDADGDSDPTFLDATGRVQFYRNERSGSFVPTSELDQPGRALSIAVADMDYDGTFDLIALQDDGTLIRTVTGEADATSTIEVIVDVGDLLQKPTDPGIAKLIVADLDNNGGLDLVISTPEGTGVWQRHADGSLQRSALLEDVRVFDVGDRNGDGLLDLVSLSAVGDPVDSENLAEAGYHFSEIRPRSISALGDRRINTYGIGGEIEVKSGLVFQKQRISRPVVHFGLGDRPTVDAARIIWPNGDTQAEFDFESNTVVEARQRLKGSCPWLFTFNGRGMTFVTDFIWRSPLGLRINAVETAGVMTTEDWVKIRGDQLVEKDGRYEVRITAELWETHFFDHVSLIVVDHPVESEVFVDERFAFPPPELRIHETGKLKSVVGAWDHRGRDVLDIVREVDERYLGGFGLATHQGRTEDHFVEVDLGSVPRTGPVWLLASGWVYPTDSSINVALGQGEFAPSSGVQLEVLGSDGKWTAKGPNLGFPSGKMKTMLIDLTGVFESSEPGRLRLRTNLEIYWDAISWAEGISNDTRAEYRVKASTAELRYRGFSTTQLPDRTHPEVPIYDEIASTGQIWRDLVGYHTRFGDVAELLEQVDDRYVIMNAGDEMIFTFEAPPPPPSGYVRDYVLVGDGWVKDGDYNTGFSKTVRPLPDHQNADYTRAPGLLEEDPVYLRHPGDWETYHTRFVSPRRFSSAMESP